MTSRQLAKQLLQKALCNDTVDFRDGQWEAIDAIVNQRRKLLVVQRTGWGKSSVYFIATRILRDQGAGITLIVSPLLALMRNQIESASRLGIRAVTINSTNQDQWQDIQQLVVNSEADVLLISPEKFANDNFVNSVLLPIANRIGLFVVDEAHCISDWGHDFRPDYRRLVNVLQRMPPNMPVLGTTATANDRVIGDITSQLGDILVQRGPLTRETLALQTTQLPDQSARLAWLANHLPDLPGTGIVYVLTKRDADQVADWLNTNGIESRAYYSGVVHPEFSDSDSYRQHLEGLLYSNQLKALVATTALGMGYDKPDLGFVVHYQASGSIIAYYQQVGRAGRGVDHAVGVLLSGVEDDEIHNYFRSTAFPSEAQVNAILNALSESNGLSIRELESSLNLRFGQIEKVLKFLSVENPAPLLKIDSKWQRTSVIYHMNQEKIQHLTQQREQEWQEVQDYIATPNCKMMHLALALDDQTCVPCGRCASCIGRPIVPETYMHETTVAAALFLKHSEFPIKIKIQVPASAFENYGFRGNLPANLRAETGRVLSRWGDAGWGRVVADDKHAGRFRDELVIAMAEMIRERWHPNPMPTWVTCVPSRTHPTLVPDFSRRLAHILGLPFHEALAKIRENEQQKMQQNRYHQCRNLDGVFVVMPDIPTGPVLLVDDIVDSGWTLTVAAALLRRAGCDNVWPIALAMINGGD